MNPSRVIAGNVCCGDRKGQSTWKTFLGAHREVPASIDFTTIEVWTKSGRITCYLLFVTEFRELRVCSVQLAPLFNIDQTGKLP